MVKKEVTARRTEKICEAAASFFMLLQKPLIGNNDGKEKDLV